ncbi:MAG: hypothetical protein RLZZ86_691 [Cyanobacteriota bacterium]
MSITSIIKKVALEIGAIVLVEPEDISHLKMAKNQFLVIAN